MLITGMLVQRFEFVDYTDYQLRTRQALTIKPEDFRIQVRPRPGVMLDQGRPSPVVATDAATTAAAVAVVPPANQHGTPLNVLYGSNLGTAEALATTLASEGTERGFAVTLGALDDHVDDLPTDGATLIVTASYNGTPLDNAAEFVNWLEDPATPVDACAGVSYAVFGCGDRAWASTYQRIPTLVDTQLEARGAKRIHDRGEGDASADFDDMYEGWHGALWTDLVSGLDLPSDVAEPVLTKAPATASARRSSDPAARCSICSRT
jgi:cytochrome P450/NADPH-cytochrome P450 reductase